MKIFPAIDLKNNKCVRLSRGKDDTSVIFNDNPVDQAIYFEQEGCERIHIVDLDAAFGRRGINNQSILKIIKAKNNEGKIYEIGGPKIISFGDMVKSIMQTLKKKRLVVEMPMPLAKIQSSVMSLLPIPPILTKDQCEILSEADNIVSNNYLTLQDLNLKPGDVEEAMSKWLWRYREGGQFARVK